MRVLRFVGPGEDERHLLVETVEGGEQFSLYVTSELRQAASIDLPRLGMARVTESPVSPREIQVRVRAGESPEEIAEQAHMSLDRVMRFAAAVVQERIRVTGEARVARARRNSPDGEFVIFGEHVDARFSTHGIDPNAVSWDSYRTEQGAWTVSATWQGGDLKRVARWTFMLSARTIGPIDDTAADLLSDRPIRPVVHVVYDMPITNPSDSPTGPIPLAGMREELFDQLARPRPDQRDAARDGDSSGAGEDDDSSDNEHASILPLRGVPDPLPPLIPGLEESDDDKAARARIPSWDDILMGVRRKRD